MIRNFAVVGPGQATRERLTAALAAAPDMAVYRIGRGADPLPVSATFDPADQPGCRSLLDWFERGAPSGAVLLVDDWALCFEQDPELDRTVEWIAAFGPSRGVQVVVTARKWADLPDRLRRHFHGEPTDFLGLHGIEADLGDMWQRDDLKAAVGVDERGWPVDVQVEIGGAVHRGTPEQLQSSLLGLMATHSADYLQYLFIDGSGSGVFDPLAFASQVTHTLTPAADDATVLRLLDALAGELGRRQEIVHNAGKFRNLADYREAVRNGAPLDPIADLMICVDGAEALFSREPLFGQHLLTAMRAGRVLGMHVLYSGGIPQTPYELPEWPLATPTYDLAEMLELLPHATGGGVAHEIMLPPLGHDGTLLTLDMLPPGALGVVDKPYEHRRDLLVPDFTTELRHGAIVGAPGTGKSTTLRTLATVLGDLSAYQLLDGPGEPLDPQRHIVVTARTWDQVPPFIRDSLAFGIELRLDDPNTSLINARSASHVPHLPGIGLSVRDKTAVQIALP
ncbi:hypothetical protein FXN61_03055 [Lentzea sp. PSKA42]|uniref:FtsK domain-containing protein n=1 Tax=Lentzea indica TaxID=2604800 RepID=A0ABX1FAB5_9PSEU|nr:FtsK/SpoIIIE domain-containing protein [Lentzea indica]NKE55855.1 hypothetical protein [Lentzea indica]